MQNIIFTKCYTFEIKLILKFKKMISCLIYKISGKDTWPPGIKCSINFEIKKNLKLVLVFAIGILFFTLSSTAQVKFDKNWTLRKDIPVFSEPENKKHHRPLYV